ncbi:MAG TPA: hypothetical protein VF460_11745 [Burkholderiales bacterium]
MPIHPGTVYFQIRWPSEGFPKAVETVFSGNVDADTWCTVSVLPKGCLQTDIASSDAQVTSIFQMMRIKGTGYAVLAFSWGDDGKPSCYINGAQLNTIEQATGRIFELVLRAEQKDESHPVVHVSDNTLAKASNNEWLFLETLRDMDARILRHSDYDLVRLSALIRQLLLDDVPLAHLVNRDLNVKIRFDVMVRQGPEPAELIEAKFQLFSLSPDGLVSERNTLDQFLGRAVLRMEKMEFSVKEVIRTVAHVLGGVHSGQAKNDLEEKLVQLESKIRAHGSPMPLYVIQDIAKVVVQAMLPIAAAIVTKYEK